ncbi:MAG: thioredoxin domain-containing protein, partial [Firmicutes bacterium]|nr:thioredoxin domain-containing protein [Bacillota bacterium]
TDAIDKAKAFNKPIFLSIGYSTCHWCHVMTRESFSDEEVSKILNDHFISIKVDREQHPDVDAVYMDACVKMTGSGGWPLSVFLTPDLKPFFAGTYFPKESSLRSISFISLLEKIALLWDSDKERLLEQSNEVLEYKSVELEARNIHKFSVDVIRTQIELMKSRYDAKNGGFLPAPKFPQLQHLLLFLDASVTQNDKGAFAVADHTLKSLVAKGCYDQVGGGLYRYSTDPQYKIPHFEKMLYDNAFLLYSLGEFYSVTKDAYFKEKCLQVFDYLESNLKAQNGGYYTAQDADSKEGEGAFYLYTKPELVEILTQSELATLTRYYEISEGGNFEGKIHLFLKSEEAFEALTAGIDREMLESIYKKIRSYREENRTLPFTDTKILVFANGLLLCGLANNFHLHENIKKAARALYKYLKDIVVRKELPGALTDSGQVISKGHLDDFAFLAWGFLEYGLKEGGKEGKDAIRIAGKLTAKANELFLDIKNGGYFSSSADTILPTRPKTIFEGAIPKGNSIMCLVLYRLFQLTGDLTLRDKLEKTLNQAMSLLDSYPTGAPFLSLVGAWYLGDYYEIVLAGSKVNQELLEQIRSKVDEEYLGGHLCWIAEENSEELLIEADKKNAGINLYLCTGGRCEKQISSKDEIDKKLQKIFN